VAYQLQPLIAVPFRVRRRTGRRMPASDPARPAGSERIALV